MFHGLQPERIEEIAESLLMGQDFMCHKTIDYTDDGAEVVSRTRSCAGAVATLERENKSPQLKQISERLGFKVATIDPDAPVYDSIDEWAEALIGDYLNGR